MSRSAPVQQKKGIQVSTILLVLFVAAIATFAFMNLKPVDVWPLGPGKPLTLVIGISFVLGALTGWLLRSVTHRRVIVERQVN